MDRDPKEALDDTVAAPAATPASDAATVTTIANDSELPAPMRPSWPTSSGVEPGAPASSLVRYKLGAVIGRGGMGEVVAARDEQIGRSVAIKRMRATDPTPEATARFVREARIQGRLDHPAVVPVHEVWHDAAGRPFFVMKHLAGVTLADVLADRDASKRPRQVLLRAFVDVCLAVEFAHTRGVVHRDLKPANIVLGDFGDVYVLDWGIARVMGEDPSEAMFADVAPIEDAATAAGAVLGTPGYMSPEQVRGDAGLDGRSDVYALGCILFEILAGEPLHARGPAGMASALAGADARPSARGGDQIAPELDAICVAATSLDRADRQATAREVGDAVQRFLDGDRDLALRKELAATAMAAARAALARGNGATERRDAIRAAARALALDPKAREPAELVGHLMLEPPAEVPPEVDRELAAIEITKTRSQARVTLLGVLVYLGVFPIMYWVGFRDAWYLITGTVLVAVLFAMAVAVVRRPTRTLAWIMFSTNLIVIAMLSRVVTPFVLAPGLALVGAMQFAMHPSYGRVWTICTGSLAAVFVPLALELAGVLSRTTSVVGGDLVLHSSAARLHEVSTLTGLVVFVVALVTAATTMSRAMALQHRRAQSTVQLQAWQLRQLVPRASTSAD